MFGRFLCWLGVHDWVFSSGKLTADDLVSLLSQCERVCCRCGKIGAKPQESP